LLALQVNGGELNIQDAWIRPLTPGQEDAMVGMVINSDRQARVIAVISPAYKFVAIQGPGKNGANNARELEFIDLPAQKPFVLGAETVHLVLSGNKKTLGPADKVPVIFSVQFDDRTSKVITVMAQPVLSKGAAAMPLSSNDAAQASTVVPPAAPRPPVEIAKKVEAKTDTPPPQPASSKAKASPVVAPKPPVAEVKPLKAAPVAAPKPAPAPVVARVAAPLPAPVAAPAPVAVVAPVVAPLAVEPKKAPEAKPAEQPKSEKSKQDAAQSDDECLNLAIALRDCDKSNDMMVEWCTTSAKSKYSCKLTMEQLKKLGN